MGGAGQPLDFQLHQALGREADHFAQKIGVGALSKSVRRVIISSVIAGLSMPDQMCPNVPK